MKEINIKPSKSVTIFEKRPSWGDLKSIPEIKDNSYLSIYFEPAFNSEGNDPDSDSYPDHWVVIIDNSEDI